MDKITRSQINFKANVSQKNKTAQINQNTNTIKSADITESSLNCLSRMNMSNINFQGKKYNGHELALSEQELDKKLNEQSAVIDFNPTQAFDKLHDGDKKALAHLVKAANILGTAFLKQDNPKNLEMKATLEKAAKDGDKHAEKTLKIFNIFRGVEALDGLSEKPIALFKGLSTPEGKAFYPQDLKKEEFVGTIKKMLTNGQDKEVNKILSARTMVIRDGDALKAVDYTDAFSKEFKAAATELNEASKHTTHKDLSAYLKAQAEALSKNDEELDCKADTIWASLQDSPLEFTITRENYDDGFTGAVFEDPELKKMLDDKGIKVNPKDSLGIRVGIVDQESTNDMLDYKKHLKALSKLMPFNDQYQQSVDTKGNEEVKQTIADVDLVVMQGDSGAVRGGITIAENLPNDDKLSVQRGGGRRNVFHKQIRNFVDVEKQKKFLAALVDPSQHSIYNHEADHLFTIGHELTHSLGPGDEYKSSLGKYGSIIEEAKADLGSIVGTQHFVECGKYTPKQRDEILFTWAAGELPVAKPSMEQAHRVRSIMQLNYFRDKGAVKFEKDGKLSVDLEKMIPTAKQMLGDVVKLQLDGDAKKAKEYIEKWSQWNDALEYSSQELKKLSPKPYKILNMELAQKLTAEN